MRKYKYNLDIFKKEDDLSFYLLGSIITDGCIVSKKDKARRVSIDSKDVSWLNAIASLIDPNLKTRETQGAYRLDINSTELCEWLYKWNCGMRKSLTVTLPNIPTQYFADFIRGCVDGDGSISQCKYEKNKNNKTYQYTATTCYICGSSKLFMKALSNRLNEFNFKHSFITINQSNSTINGRAIIAKNPIYRISFSGKKAISFLQWCYYPGNKLSMQRKQLLINNFTSQFS